MEEDSAGSGRADDKHKRERCRRGTKSAKARVELSKVCFREKGHSVFGPIEFMIKSLATRVTSLQRCSEGDHGHTDG